MKSLRPQELEVIFIFKLRIVDFQLRDQVLERAPSNQYTLQSWQKGFHITELPHSAEKDFSKVGIFGGVPAFFPAMEMLSIAADNFHA